ncbi:MAG: sugar phosphate isomerase/epimerase [Clostridia bacterium]|nr:sugar phosphate isomerase/epimerase [Clostridia bacterium]
MNIGIRLHDTAPGTLEQRLDFARAQGFSCAHLALSKALPDFSMADAPARLADASLARRVRAAFDDRGMGCAVLGCYLKLAVADEAELRRTQEIYRAHLRFARQIGAGVVGTETPLAAGTNLDPRSDEALELFIRCARPVVQCAEAEGVTLAIEPVCSHIVSTPERAERVLDALKSDRVRIILDAVNLLSSDMTDRADAVIDEAIQRLGNRVSVLHMKDFADAPGESRPRPVACGEGRMRYEGLLRLARRRALPMTLENTEPGNAEAARLYLEKLAEAI